VRVRPGELADLSELLGRAKALVASFESTGTSIPIDDRPGFLVAQPHNDPQPIIERLASAERLTFVVGAGASMEAGLPSWAGLVRGLLEACAPGSLNPSDRAAWLDAAAESGLLGMAATARALAGSDAEFMKRVDQHLYRGKGANYFDPGPLAREIAAWKRAYPKTQLATFNYDLLLERALDDARLAAEPREDNETEPDDVAFVRHLHGLLTGAPSNDALVLTERDYAVWSPGAWQDKFMSQALNGVCVFLGLSFTDQNLLRWIYGATGSRHIALLTRQSSPRLSGRVRRELESANRSRLARAHVTVYWADFYAEVAQLMHEARRRKGPGKPPTSYPLRAQKRALKGRRRCLPASALQARQVKLREILAGSLAGVRAALATVGVDATDDVLGLGLWGLDYARREVTLWGSSDRVHVDPSTVVAVALDWDSKWVAVEAITQGSVVEWDPDTYASRWRSVRGIPLVWTRQAGRERIIVGAATLTSTEPTGSSIFDQAEEAAPGIRRTIDIALHDKLVRLWNRGRPPHVGKLEA
jgi:SIR2-like protein